MSPAAKSALRGDESFHIADRDANLETGEIRLRYHFGDAAQLGEGDIFEEVITLPPASTESLSAGDAAGFEAAARILHLTAGTSYFKSQAPDTIVIDEPEGITTAEADLVRALYDDGLREFATRNNLDIPLVSNLEFTVCPAADRPESENLVPGGDEIGRPLLPFGGGKDSTVVQHLVPEAQPLTVNPTSTHNDVAQVLGHELLTVRRVVSRIDELTSADRLNGHVPITAIVSAISCCAAVRGGYDTVIMANERSSSEPTMWDDTGRAINHQYSKSGAFEDLLSSALTAAGVGVRYFSMLRPVGEAEIAAVLATIEHALPVLLSCNNAFKGSGSGSGVEVEQAWCGVCPKCHFSYLMLATQLDPTAMIKVFGRDLLTQPALIGSFAALWDLDAKPWECVGERSEAAQAMVVLFEDSRWSRHAVVTALGASARDALVSLSSQPAGEDNHGNTKMPARYLERMITAFPSLADAQRAN